LCFFSFSNRFCIEALVNDDEFKDLPEDIRAVLLDVNTYCYRVPMRDPENRLRLGTGYHCVSQIVQGDEVIGAVEFVIFRFAEGAIVARMYTTLQKNLTGNTDAITREFE